METSSSSSSPSSSSSFTEEGFRQPFTPLQALELMRQIEIYKYLEACVPLRISTIPEPFNPGPTLNTYEAGRCRRTDGKKWQCSRDAITNQRYCERHINRGRHCTKKLQENHSSRKLVEGRTGRRGRPLNGNRYCWKDSCSTHGPITRPQQMENLQHNIPRTSVSNKNVNEHAFVTPTFFSFPSSVDMFSRNTVPSSDLSSSSSMEFAFGDGSEMGVTVGDASQEPTSCKNNLSSSNVMTEEWDLSPEFVSSPTYD